MELGVESKDEAEFDSASLDKEDKTDSNSVKPSIQNQEVLRELTADDCKWQNEMPLQDQYTISMKMAGWIYILPMIKDIKMNYI